MPKSTSGENLETIKNPNIVKPVPQPYVLIGTGAQQYALQVIANPNSEYLMPNLITMAQYEELESGTSVALAEALYDEPNGEGPKRISAAAALLRDKGDGYLVARLEMKAADVDEELKGVVGRLAPQDAKIAIALEWSCLHALIMQSQEEIAKNTNEIKELKKRHDDVPKPAITSPTGRAGDAMHVIEDGVYTSVSDVNNESLKAALSSYKESVEPFNSEIRGLEKRNTEILKNIEILTGQSKAHQDKLRELSPEAFAGVGVAGSSVYLDFASDDVPPLFTGSANPKVDSPSSTAAAATGATPSAPALSEISSITDFNWNNLPGSTEDKEFKLNLSFQGSASGVDVGNPFQLKVFVTRKSSDVIYDTVLSPLPLDEYKKVLEQEFAKLSKGDSAIAPSPSAGRLPTLFEPKAAAHSPVVADVAYEVPAVSYDYSPDKAKEKIDKVVADNSENPELAKATLAAYVLDLNAKIETARAGTDPQVAVVGRDTLVYESPVNGEAAADTAVHEAAEAAPSGSDITEERLNDLYKIVGVLSTALKSVVEKELTLEDRDTDPAKQEKTGGDIGAAPSAAGQAPARQSGLLTRIGRALFRRTTPSAPSTASAAVVPPPPVSSVVAPPSVMAPPPPSSLAPSLSASTFVGVAPSALSPVSVAVVPPPVSSVMAPPSLAPSLASLAASAAAPADPDNISITPSPITDFKPKVSAKKEFPAAPVKDEEFLDRKVVDQARDHSTKMAYLAVDNPADSTKELGVYISQNYSDLLGCGILTPYTTKIKDFVPANDAHKKEAVASASKEISQFVRLCKTYDPAVTSAEFNDFRKKIGFVEDRENPTDNKITWVANDGVSNKPVSTKPGDQTKAEQFFWQRTFLAAQRAQFMMEGGLSPTVEKNRDVEMRRRSQINEKLLDKNRSEDPNNDPDNAGLAKTGKNGLLTADGIAKHMAFFEAQDSQSAGQETPFDIFSYLSYEDFAKLSGKLAAINADGIADIDEANEAIIEAGLKDLFGGYFEFGGDSRTDTRSRSLLPMLWMLKEHTAQKDANGKIFSETFAKRKKEAQDATKTPAERDAAKASMKATAKALIDDLIGQSPADLQELYGKAKDGVKDKVLFRSDDDEASYLYKMLSENEDEKDIFDEAKQKLKERREKTPPRADEVLDARKRMAETLSKTPDKWTRDKRGNVVNKVPVLTAAAPAPILKADPSDAEKAAYKVELDAYNAANPTQAERDAHKQTVANYYEKLHLEDYEFKKPDQFKLSNFEEGKEIAADQLKTYLDNGENAVGDEGLFDNPAKSKAFLRSGFLIAEFNQPSCLYDLAAAVDKMPSSALKSKIEKGQTVYSLAYLSGDDGIQRENKYALISQNKRGTVTTFTTSEIVEQEIFDKNAKFYEENHRYAARLDSLQQAADLSTVYLQDFIAAEFRKKDPNNPGQPLYGSMEDVMQNPKIIALTNHNKDLNALLREFGSNENDDVAKRRDKMDRLQDFVLNDKPNLNPPFLTSEAKSLDDILNGLEGNMVAGSSAAKKLASLGADIKNPSHTSPAIEASARKNGQAEMQNYLREKDRVAELESKLKLHLDDKDIKVIEDDYYRANNIRPDFTKGGKSDLEKLLSSGIPGSFVPGFAIYKPKPGEPGYVRYGNSAKNPPGKANTAIVNINIPSDPVLAAKMHDTCWVYIPGTSECYVKISVDLETGKPTILPEIYHKNKGQGYDSIGSTKKSFIAALGGENGLKVYQSHQNFNVLAVSSIGGVRTGVSAKFNGNTINKTQAEIKSRATSAASLNQSSQVKNLDCKFAIDNKKRIMPDGASLNLLSPIVDDATALKSPYKATFKDEASYIKDRLAQRNFTINGKNITGNPPAGALGDKVTGIHFVYAADLPGEVGGIKTYSKKSMRLDPPKAVLTYVDAKGEQQKLIFDASPENMKEMLGDKPGPDFQELLNNAKNAKLGGAEAIAASSVTLVDGIHLPKSFGDMVAGIDENKVRIVLPVMAIKGEERDKMAFHAPVIEYYKDGSSIPHYMAFNKENLSKLYRDELLPSTFDNLAARVDVQVDNTRVPVVFEHRDAKGDIVSQAQLEVKSFIDSDRAIDLNIDKGKNPNSTCAVISAELVKGQELDRANAKAGKKGGSSVLI